MNARDNEKGVVGWWWQDSEWSSSCVV